MKLPGSIRRSIRITLLSLGCAAILAAAHAQSAKPQANTPVETTLSQPQTVPAVPAPQRRIIPFPVIISDPTNGFGGGGGILTLYRLNETAPRDSQTAVVGYYTTTASWRFAAQQIFSFGEDRFRSTTTAIAGNTNNDYRYPDVPTPVQYGQRENSLTTDFMVEIWGDLYVGASYLYRDTRFTFDQRTASIQRASATLLDTLEAIETVDSGLGLVVSFDSRDNEYEPSRGFLADLELLSFSGRLGSDHDYRTLDTSVNGYRSVADEHIVAFRVRWRGAFGDVPFTGQSYFGGVDLRAYPNGKYRGTRLIAGQLEYRFPIWKRLRGVAFGGAGGVYGDEQTLGADEFLPSGGAGIRFLLLPERDLLVGLDLAFGRFDNKGVYFSFGEAF